LLTLSHQWSAEGLTYTYGYDKTGLRTSLDVSDPRFAPLFTVNGTETNTPNNLNQYTVANNKTLTYDRNGNLTSDGTNTYSYDAINQLTAAVSTKNSTYSYDSFGRRYSKTVDGQTTVFLNDGHQEIMEYDGSGNIQKKYVFGPGIDEPILMEGADSRYYYSADALGSIIGLSNPEGNVMERYAYSPWGKGNTNSTIGNQILFTGRKIDTETLTYDFRFRHYSIFLKRFFENDPLGYFDDMNLYGYVSNSPLNWIDPFGLQRRGRGGRSGRGSFGEYQEIRDPYAHAQTESLINEIENEFPGQSCALRDRRPYGYSWEDVNFYENHLANLRNNRRMEELSNNSGVDRGGRMGGRGGRQKDITQAEQQLESIENQQRANRRNEKNTIESYEKSLKRLEHMTTQEYVQRMLTNPNENGEE
jgi:RHS repeat-associated protein